MRKLFVAGNWKMNLNRERSLALAGELKSAAGRIEDVALAVCPPFVYLTAVGEMLSGSRIALGGQNMHTEDAGAFTGEISGPMLKESGCRYVIVGHSERRHVFGETDAFIGRKVGKALRDGLNPIVCVGETLEERQSDRTRQVVCRQVEKALESVDRDGMERVTIAYEPVWAIGTGHTAAPEQAEQVHVMIRTLLGDLFDADTAEAVVIQYGGSVKPENAEELLGRENVDGALVGGASLDADTFLPIIEVAQKLS